MASLERINPVFFFILKIFIATCDAYPSDLYYAIPDIKVNIIPAVEQEEYITIEQPITYVETYPTYYEYPLLPQQQGIPPIVILDDNSNDNNNLLYLLFLLKGFGGGRSNNNNNCCGCNNLGPYYGPVAPPCGCGDSPCGCGGNSCGCGGNSCGCGGNSCGCGGNSCGCGGTTTCGPCGCGGNANGDDWPVLSITFDPCPSCSCQCSTSTT